MKLEALFPLYILLKINVTSIQHTNSLQKPFRGNMEPNDLTPSMLRTDISL